jgi:predicted aldo/keto reductase-like oxidoreductase
MERTADGIWIMEPVAGGRSFDTVSEEESNF